MSFFESYFGLYGSYGDEQQVCCPFPHHTTTGAVYKESHASASVNVRKHLFHCKVCSEGFNEESFISKLYRTTYANAAKISRSFMNSETVDMWDAEMVLNANSKKKLQEFGITDAVIDELKIRSADMNMDEIAFPVFLEGHLMDVRRYNPGNTPKMRSRVGSMPGLIVPYDIWKLSPKTRTTLICAGEKDMATTRSHGFNAITITGGELSLPALLSEFEGRDVVILYDNDDAGKKGAIKLASALLPICKTVKVCTKFHEICVENKEDITDFWNKYQGTRDQLIRYMDTTPLFTQDDIPKYVPVEMTLAEATHPENLNKLLTSNVQVISTAEARYAVPTEVIAEKYKTDESQGQTMYEGEVRDWTLIESNLVDMLHLVDNGFTEDDIRKNLKTLMKIPIKERNVKVTIKKTEIVYKGYVTDMFESMKTDNLPMEYEVYSLGTRLESGKKYTCTYKIVTHPYKGGHLIMLITSARPATDSVSNFRITPDVIKNLQMFQRNDLTVAQQVDDCVQRVKGLLGYNGNDTLIKIIDLAYHTPIAFNLGKFTNVRAYLDTLVVGESRVGKSSTAEALRKTYQLGTFTSLAGNSATIPGLVGGSNKTGNGSMQTKAGLIPQNHKGLMIFEEFGKCKNDLITELTDIRSSNEVRITRVSGTLTLPAMVRMISLSNVKNFSNTDIKSIMSYPGGIQIIVELVPTAEDIARYDLLCVLGDKGAQEIDPYWEPMTPYPDKAYQDRVRWVWSRTPDEICISPEIGRYIIDQANELNKDFDCHIKVFGTEAWKKLARLSIAIAGYCVSSDDSYNNLIVKKEHVQYAVNTFCELYDNPVFRLRQYVEEERKYSRVTEESTEKMKDMWNKAPAMLMILEQEARPTKTTIMAATGTAADDYNALMSEMVKHCFVKLNGNEVLPTEKFRKTIPLINRTKVLRKLGEING